MKHNTWKIVEEKKNSRTSSFSQQSMFNFIHFLILISILTSSVSKESLINQIDVKKKKKKNYRKLSTVLIKKFSVVLNMY